MMKEKFTVIADSKTEIKPSINWCLNVEDIKTPEDLLRAFQALGTIFTIVEDSETWYKIAEVGLGHLLTREN